MSELREKIENLRGHAVQPEWVAHLLPNAGECDTLLRALDVLEAVEWIEANPSRQLLIATGRPWRDANGRLSGIVAQSEWERAGGGTVVEAVNALKSALNKEKSGE